MASAQQDLALSAQVTGALSKLPGKAGVCFGVASASCSILGSILGMSQESPEEKFDKAVLKDLGAIMNTLGQISQQLQQIDQELGAIETLLNKVYEQIEETNNIEIAKLLGVIDAAFSNFQSLDPTLKANLHVITKAADDALKDSNSLLSSMTTINEVLMSNVFTPGNALQGTMPISGYLYLQAKLTLGLNLLGYACHFASGSRDFGTFLKQWNQNFADQMKSIIAYGKENPTIQNLYTAHFYAYWNSFTPPVNDKTGPRLHCTDSLPFSADFTPSMPYPLQLVTFKQGSQFETEVVFDGVPYDFQNHYNQLAPDTYSGAYNPEAPQSYFSCWATEQNFNEGITMNDGSTASLNIRMSNIQTPVNIPPDPFPNKSRSDLPPQFRVTGAYSPWNEVYFLYTILISDPDTYVNYDQSVFLQPHYKKDGSFPMYLGSADGMLNLIEGPTQTLVAFIYDGLEKGNLLTVDSATKTPSSQPLSNLNSLTPAMVEITAYQPYSGAPQIQIKFKETGKYLRLNDDGEWMLSDDEMLMVVQYPDPAPQPIDDPYSMKPVGIALGMPGSITGATKAALIHQAPFE